MIQTTYSEAREHLASLMDRVTADREKVIIKRRGACLSGPPALPRTSSKICSPGQ